VEGGLQPAVGRHHAPAVAKATVEKLSPVEMRVRLGFEQGKVCAGLVRVELKPRSESINTRATMQSDGDGSR